MNLKTLDNIEILSLKENPIDTFLIVLLNDVKHEAIGYFIWINSKLRGQRLSSVLLKMMYKKLYERNIRKLNYFVSMNNSVGAQMALTTGFEVERYVVNKLVGGG